MRKVAPAPVDEEYEDGEIAVDKTADADIVDGVEHPLRHYLPHRQPIPSHPFPPH